MQTSLAGASPYYSINSLMIGPRISEPKKSLTPFCLQYENRHQESTRELVTPTHIRFVIVRDGGYAPLEKLILESWSSPWVEDHDRRHRQPISRYRDVLRSRKERNSPKDGSCVLTVVYEVVYMNEVRIGFICPPECAQPQPNSSRVILIDHTFLLPRHPSSWSTMIYVQSTVPAILYKGLSLDWDIEYKNQRSRQRKLPIPSILHLTTIKMVTRPSPIVSRPSSFPLNILREIALQVVKYRPPTWRQQLLALGLVSKSWAPVLDLFFELHAESYFPELGEDRERNPGIFDIVESTHRPPQLIRVARSLLSGQPQRALSMQKFSLSHYVESRTGLTHAAGQDEYREAVLASIACIIKYARSLKEITLYVDFLLDQSIQSVLWSLALVERFTLHSMTNHNRVSIGHVQQLLARWPKLRAFAWSGISFSGSMPRQSVENQAFPDIRLECSLEKLTIISDDISTTEFLRFFQVPSPRLHSLRLERVNGLVNGDLYLALSTVTTSLKDIHICRSTVSKLPDEENALDALISQMNNLDTLAISSNFISTLMVERKTPGRIKTELTVNDIKDASILENLARAIQASSPAWESISFMHNGSISSVSPYLGEIGRVADECGIDFLCMVDPMSGPGGFAWF